MAEAGGAFVTRAFERMLKDSAGRKYGSLQTALKAYLGEDFFWRSWWFSCDCVGSHQQVCPNLACASIMFWLRLQVLEF